MSIQRLFRISIDHAALRANLSRQEQRVLNEQEVRCWLRDAGFMPAGDRWLVREPDLGQLEPEEVSSAEIVADAAAADYAGSPEPL